MVVLLFLLAGAACAAMLTAGAPLVPRGVREINLPKQLREDITYARDHKKKSSLEVFFSHQEFFYNRPIAVSLSAGKPGVVIHYTLDGSDPAEHSPRYTAPLSLALPEGDGVACTVIKARAFEAGASSPVRTHSYFLGPEVDKRFTSALFSLSTDPDHLMDHQRGILTPGARYEAYMRDNPGTTVSLWRRDANYNQHGPDWERPLYVEAFTPDGNRVIAQQAGVRVHGESSRGLPQKSLRLIARKRYEPKYGKFKYPFFPNLVQADPYQAPVRTFDNLILSNGGSIHAMTTLADPVILHLARQAGYHHVSPVRSSAVFLNGAYYGHAWLLLRPNEQHFKKLYGVPEKEDFTVLSGGEHKIYSKNPVLRYEFARLHRLAAQGLTDDSRLDEFSRRMDIHNLLHYMAIELYVANSDWPRSNVRIWRYTGSRDLPNLVPDLDGRWRYFLFDLQAAMGATGEGLPKDITAGIPAAPDPAAEDLAAEDLADDAPTAEGPADDALAADAPAAEGMAADSLAAQAPAGNIPLPALESNAAKLRSVSHFAFPSVNHGLRTIPFLRALLERPELAEEFANHICDLATVHFTEERVAEALESVLAEAGPEFARAAAAAGSAGDSGPKALARLAAERERILTFSRERPAHILRELQDLFGYTDFYRIVLEGPGRINSISSGNGRYFVQNSVPLTPDLPRWHVFDHWLVNGERRTDPVLRVTAADARDGVARVTLVSRMEPPALRLGNAYDQGGICGFSLDNADNTVRHTRGLYLSDKLHNPKKWAIPDFAVAPGNRLDFVGQSYRSTDAMLKVKLNFNPRSGEVIFLSNEAGDILDALQVP